MNKEEEKIDLSIKDVGRWEVIPGHKYLYPVAFTEEDLDYLINMVIKSVFPKYNGEKDIYHTPLEEIEEGDWEKITLPWKDVKRAKISFDKLMKIRKTLSKIKMECPKGHEVERLPEYLGTGSLCKKCDIVYQESDLIKKFALKRELKR